MRRVLLSAAGVLAVVASSLAQHTDSRLLPIVNQKDAGTYHLATGTWTRSSPIAASWTDIVFDNTCCSLYYQPTVVANRVVDDGRLPSTTSPTNPGPPASAISWTGTNDIYWINFFHLAYCTFDPLPTIEVDFWDCFDGCANATLLAPTASFVLANMPGASSGGACWSVGIDLANSGLSFLLNGDCDGLWNGGGPADTFGWSWRQTTPSTGGTPGPAVAGDPLGYLNCGAGSTGCEFGAGTIFYGGASPNNDGTGLDGLDMWEEDVMSPTPAYGTCWWYGGYNNGFAYASFHLELGKETGTPPPQFQFCAGDGIPPHTPCPCANDNDGSASPGGGCAWGMAFPEGGILSAVGSYMWSWNDTHLVATSVPNDFGIFFAGSSAVNMGNGNPLNDGLRCVGGGVVRLNAPLVATGNTLTTPAPLQTLDPGGGVGIARYYQYWFRSPGGPCGTTANLTNGVAISWL